MSLLTCSLVVLAAPPQALLPAPNFLRAATPAEAGLDGDLLRAAVRVVEEATASDAAPKRMSAVFVRTKRGAWRARWSPGDPPDYPFVRASGGMIATARDYATFCQALLQGGTYEGRRVLAADSVRAMLAPQNSDAFDGRRVGPR